MELFEAIFQRHVARDYTDQSVAPILLDQLMRAAVQAPSSLNQQPWAFAVFSGKPLLREYSDRAKAHYLATELPPFGCHERGETLTETAYNIFYNASTLLVIYSRAGGDHATEDCCLAAENLMLAAHGLGLGSCPVGLARPWLNLPEVKDELGIPLQLTAVFPLTVGYPAAPTGPTSRKAPEIVSWRQANC